MYYFLLLVAFIIPNINFFTTNFLEKNSEVINSKIKKIEFNYSLEEAIILSGNAKISKGTSNLIITDTCYKYSINNLVSRNTFISNGEILKSYNPHSNQIFIEDANKQLDSVILNLFNNLETHLNTFTMIDTLSNYNIQYNDVDFSIKIFTNNYSIDSLIIELNTEKKQKIQLFNIKLSTYQINTDSTPFSFDSNNAFILDLRD